INLLTTATNFHLIISRRERAGLMLLGVLMALIAATIAWEKPHALVFAGVITLGGFALRAVGKARYLHQWWQRYRHVLLPHAIPPELKLPSVHPASGLAAKSLKGGPMLRILVATRGGSRLLQFALEEARNRQAELFVLFVRQLAVIPMGSVTVANIKDDEEARLIFQQALQAAAEIQVPLRPLYAVGNDVAEIILELTVTYGVDLLIMGISQRGRFWRLMKGDVIQQVAQYLPERTTLLIHA
ncbi:MAG: universal stress protein, partial [Gemmataceae bacterium]|nr:universal stress protein [Gemmataceae bacterium]